MGLCPEDAFRHIRVAGLRRHFRQVLTRISALEASFQKTCAYTLRDPLDGMDTISKSISDVLWRMIERHDDDLRVGGLGGYKDPMGT